MPENSSGQIPQNAMLLTIRNDRPLLAPELGELLLALSRDYREVNRGRSLAVTRIQTGTILITLSDVLAAAKPYLMDGVQVAIGAKAIVVFITSLRGLIAKRKGADHPAKHDTRKGPHRSVEAMVKIAAETGRELLIRHVAASGETLEVDLSPADAAAIREQTRHVQQQLRIREEIPVMPVKSFADEIERIGVTDVSGLHPLITTVVRLLVQTGNERLVEMLAKELETRGYSEWAAGVRGAVQKT